MVSDLAGRLRRAAAPAAWAWTALMGLVVITQALGWTELAVVVVLQALTPLLLAPSVPLLALACWRRRWRLAAVDAGIALALCVLVVPVLTHGSPPDVPPGAPALRIAFANTYYENPDPEAAAAELLALDADLVAMAEYSLREDRAMEAAGAFAAYPYRIGIATTDRDGIVLYSRFPFVTADDPMIGTVRGIDAVVAVDGIDVRVIVVHPKAAVHQSDLDDWQADLAAVHEDMVDTAVPTVIVGDFNASRWHPDFRDMLDGTGFHDVHEWLGEGFSCSWPNDQPFPPFVRIDHALVDGLVPSDLADVDVPGSDHRGFVVSLAVAPGR